MFEGSPSQEVVFHLGKTRKEARESKGPGEQAQVLKWDCIGIHPSERMKRAFRAACLPGTSISKLFVGVSETKPGLPQMAATLPLASRM